MSGIDGKKPAAKSGRRSKKAEARRPKADLPESPAPAVQTQSPEPQVQPEPTPAVEADAQPAVSEPVEAFAAAAGAPPPDAPSPEDAAPAEPAPVSLQTIANAYRDYTRKSFAEFGSFFEQLSGVRSLDKAVEVQTEFVKRAYENSMAESHKIRELHRKLARQTMEPFEGIAGKSPETHGKP